jgi:MFS family permease
MQVLFFHFFFPFLFASFVMHFFYFLILLAAFSRLGFYSSAIFFVGVPSSIATGWVISKYGHTLSIISLAGALYTWSCMILCMLRFFECISSSSFLIGLALTTINPMFGLVGLGVATGLFEPTANTAIARVLPEEGSDTAYGGSYRD